ncbi:MAG TPA: kelch repeat-containing protein [Gaiellaceae bacterium]|nr:kelch repeat-containing protein [Gaiellaceae bacterium]
MRIAKWLVVAATVLVVLLVVSLLALSLAPDRWLAAVGYDIAGERLVTGMLVTGTPARPVLYVSSSDPRIGAGLSGTDRDVDTNSGVISRLTWTGSEWKRLDLVRGLPRSEEDHATNGLALDPATRTLYVAQGSNTNEGAPSAKLGHLPEYALSAAILAIDLRRIGEHTYDLPTLDDEKRDGEDDDGDPFGGNHGRNQARVVPGGPVRVYAPGFRNAYDVVVTSKDRVYSSQNGGAADWGEPPAREGPAGRCTNEPREPGHYDPDSLHLVLPGRYYGHPNPTRGNRENTFNSDRQSPVPRADPVECDYRRPKDRDPVVLFPTSTNGLAEYTASSFGGAMRGNLLAASFDTQVYRVVLNERGDRALSRRPLLRLRAPLDVAAQGDDGPFPGTIWVGEYNGFIGSNAGPNIFAFEPKDPATSSGWESLASTGLVRQEVSFVRVGDRFYLAGGSRTQQAYEPRTNSWRNVAPLPRNLDHIQGVELGGRIYYVGGLAAWPKPAVASVYVYGPAADRFSTRRPMSRPRGAGGVAVHGGKIYYAGGLSDGRAVTWFDVYDPQRNLWSRLPDMPRPRDHFQAVVLDGKFYAIGGRDSELGKEYAETDAFDFATGRWETGLAPIPTKRGGFAAAVLGDEILVIGGEDANSAHREVEAYDVRRDRWRTLDPMPTARHGTQAVVCGGAVYVAAGGGTQGGENPTDVLEVYRPAGARGCARAHSLASATRPSFEKRVVDGTSSDNPTVLQLGPDGRLYVAQQSGIIKAYEVVREDGRFRVADTETIESIRWIPNHDDDGSSVTDLRSLARAVGDRLGL